jgi:hypothetical protein
MASDPKLRSRWRAQLVRARSSAARLVGSGAPYDVYAVGLESGRNVPGSSGDQHDRVDSFFNLNDKLKSSEREPTSSHKNVAPAISEYLSAHIGPVALSSM